ncbi:MAG: hypothetical protein FWG64_14375 [Firmicutes bacterium]|nr:hypothetical protein [Bacillota bacterium]
MKPNQQKPKPLGYVDLPNGPKAIFPMNDIFLAYSFDQKEQWEILRLIINILIAAYLQVCVTSKLKPITGKIKVQTQFKYFLDTNWKDTREQDIKLSEEDFLATYIEFQNRANVDPPVEIRSVDYLGLGIVHGKGKLTNQIWLLAEDVKSVTQENKFARYILADEQTGNEHPINSGILYINLPKLAQENSPAGELAEFLLGKTTNPKNKDVRKIARAFSKTFGVFKQDKEATKVLSFRDRNRKEASYDTLNKIEELVNNGLSLEDAFQKVREETSLQFNSLVAENS